MSPLKLMSVTLLMVTCRCLGQEVDSRAAFRALEGVADQTQATQRIRASFADVGSDEFRQPDEPLELRIACESNCYVTLIVLDSHGVLELIEPDFGTAGNLLRAGAEVFYPADSATGALAARLPVGPTQLYVVGADRPAGSSLDAGLHPGSRTMVSADEAPRITDRLTTLIKEQSVGAAQIIPLRYIVRTGADQYTAEQIVQYFTETTRSIERPSLDVYVNFPFDSDKPLRDSEETLDMWGQVLSDPLMRDHRFAIRGHTDDVGTDDYNVDLSMRRAKAVRDYLVTRHRIEPMRLEAEGHGKKVPLVHGTSRDARAANRRVDFERLSTFE